MTVRGRRSDKAGASADANRTMLCVRNPASGVIYHLVFEGSLRKITGRQLKHHLETICHIPAQEQILTYNGRIVDNESTGGSLGLYDKSVLDLQIPGSSHFPKTSPPHKDHGKFIHTAEPARNDMNHNFANEHLNRSDHTDALRHGRNGTRQPQSQNYSLPPHQAEVQPYVRDDKNSTDLKDSFDDLYYNNHHTHNNHNNDKKRYFETTNDVSPSFINRQSPRVVDPDGPAAIVLDVEEDAIDDVDHAMLPYNDADLIEAQLDEKDYIWKMEQLRFQRERMRREYELQRQRHALDGEAEALARELTLLSRRTQLERGKMWELKQWVRGELDMEAQLLDLNEGFRHSYIEETGAGAA